jgi:hypothetical protein
MSSLTTLSRTARRIYQTEGLASLLRRALAGLAYCLFEHRTYVLVDHATDTIKHMDRADLMPRTEDCSLKIVSTNGEADELETQGFEFCSHIPNARDRLGKGAVAFVVFIGGEFASIAWVAMSQEAADTLSEPPVQTDFTNGEALCGAVLTRQEYRRKRLNLYMGLHIREFLLDRGIATMRGAIGKDNAASLKANDKFSPIIYAEGRHLRVMWWKSWREKRLTAT